MTKHTGEKWYVGSVLRDEDDESVITGYNIKAEDGYHVAKISSRDEGELRANATLVAAAPELLEALIRLQKIARLVTISQIIRDEDALEASGFDPWVINEGRADGTEKYGVPYWVERAIQKATENGDYDES